jgi:hypothetical protein
MLAGLRPPPEIEIHLPTFRSAVEQAKLRRVSWLFHPCFAALTVDTDPLSAFVQVLIWISRNEPVVSWGITSDQYLTVWTAGGGEIIAPGRHTSASLASEDSQIPPSCVPIDLWGFSIGRQNKDMLSIQEPIGPHRRRRIVEGVSRLISALANMEQKLPRCLNWLRHATRLIVPLVRDNDGKVRSASRETALGAIFCDLAEFTHLLEAIIHETAHQHFYLTEMSLPLVQNESARYYSPLRKEFRPLRGVFLAYHALVHISSFYVAALETKLIPADHGETNLQVIQGDLDIARQSMAQGFNGLTDAGRELFCLLEKHQV